MSSAYNMSTQDLQSTTQFDTPASTKKVYQKPELIVYGSLEELTRGVAGSVYDNGSTTTKHPCGIGNPNCDGTGVGNGFGWNGQF